MTLDFSIEMLEARTQWRNAFKILRQNYFDTGIQYPAKLAHIMRAAFLMRKTRKVIFYSYFLRKLFEDMR